MERQLKAISKNGITEALAKVQHYRYLNQAEEAESICRDILAVDPENQMALRQLGLALTDQFRGTLADGSHEAQSCFEKLSSAYERAYYQGILHERRAKAQLEATPRPSAPPTPQAQQLVEAFLAATASGDQWSFRLYAVRFGSDVYRFIFAAKTMNAQIDRSFRDSVTSFRRMSLKESQQIHPMHLQIVTATTGDTVENLARRMAPSDNAIERFRVLNGLSATDRIKPGDKLKIVVE